MRREDGRLLHTWRGGKAKLDAYLDDYASLANALVTLYEATGDERWIDEAVRLVDVMLDKFADPAGGGFFYTADDHEQLIARTKELTDSSVPSGNALAATALLAAGQADGTRATISTRPRRRSPRLCRSCEQAPMAAGQMLLALDRLPRARVTNWSWWAARPTPTCESASAAIARPFLPRRVVAARLADANARAHRSPHLDELFAGKSRPTASRCSTSARTSLARQPAVGLCDGHDRSQLVRLPLAAARWLRAFVAAG